MKEVLMTSWYILFKLQTKHFNSFLKYAVSKNHHPQSQKYTAAIMVCCALLAYRLDMYQNLQTKPINLYF